MIKKLINFIERTFLFYILFLSVILGISAWFMWHNQTDYYAHMDNSVNVIQQQAVSEDVITVENKDGSQQEIVSINISALQNTMPNLVGWIRQENTNINYPIMKGDNNDYYLTHDAMGKTSYSGSIFMDSMNSRFWNDDNTVVYGHNMKNESMFGSLKNYMRVKSYIKDHPEFIIYTNDSAKVYRIISVYAMKYGNDQYKMAFDSKEEYEEFLKTAVERSEYDTGVKYDPNCPCITLTTCYSSGTKGIKTMIVLQEK